MKKQIQLLAICAFTVNAFAQPMIPNGNNIPTPGLSVPVSVATTLTAGAAGPNQTWDFSTLSFTPLGTVDVISPSSSPIGSSFPTSNYALSLSSQNSFSFFNVSSSKMEVQAWTISSPGVGNDYSPNPRTLMRFPFNYLDTESDTWQKVGGSVENVTVTYDGYGTLITPTFTYTNVVRIKEDYGGTDIDYQWYTVNPLMAVAIFDHNNNTLYHFGATPNKLSDKEPLSNHVVIYPNPADNEVCIEQLPVHSSVMISDVTGKLLFNTTVNAERINVNTTTFASGIYLLTIEHNGKKFQEKLVKK